MIVIAAEVEEALGQQITNQVRRETTTYNCVYCSVSGDAAHEDTAVVILRGPQTSVIRLGHTSCGPSQIVTDEAIGGELARAGILELDPNRDVRMTAALIPLRGRQNAWLFVRPEPGTGLYLPSGDKIDPWTTTLLDGGWQLGTRFAQKATTPHPGWELWVELDGSGCLVDPDGGLLLDRLSELPAGWVETAFQNGSVQVLASEDLDLDTMDSMAAIAGMAAARSTVEEAIHAGRLVMAAIPIRLGRPDALGQASQPQDGASQLAEGLGEVMSARAGGKNALADLPDLLPLPTSATVHLGTFEQRSGVDAPLFMLNLGIQDQNQAGALLDELETAGFPRNRDPYSRPWPLAPEGWAHLCWPSQLLILNTKDRPRHKLLFRPFQANSTWYEQVMASPQNAIGLLIYNAPDAPIDRDAITAVAAQGNAIAVALVGMCAV